MKYVRFLWLISLVVALPIAVRAADIRIQASVDATPIGLQEQFTLSVEVTGSDATSAPEPVLPAMDAFAAYAGVSTSQNIQFINGRMSASKTYNYAFVARAVGRYEIGPVKLTYKGETFTTAPIQIEIVQQSAPSPGAPGRPNPSPAEPGVDLSKSLFLRTVLERRKVFQNEPLVVTYKIYTRVTVTSYGISQLPNYSGFWAEDFPMPQQPRTLQEVIDGQRFLVAEIKKVALFPQSAGKNTLAPLEIQCDVQMQNRKRSRDLFDSFFDDPFLTRTVRQAVSSSPLDVEVEALPAQGKPADFSGAVGSYSIAASLNRDVVKTNEAVTLKVVVSGSGNLRVLPAPVLDLPSDFEVYDPKIDQSIKYENNRVSGSKTFEYVMVPRSPGDIELKPVRLSYFDPRERAYKTASTRALPLAVTKGAEDVGAVSGGISKEDVRLIGQDIRFIAATAAPFQSIGAAFHRSPLFYAMGIGPVLALGMAVLYRRHQEKLSTNVAYARSRRAGRLATQYLRNSRKLAGKSDGKAFYAEVQRALMSFVGNKLNLAEAGLVTDQLAAALGERRVPSEVINAYLNCLQACDFKRFAPGQISDKEMHDFVEQAEHAIDNLERVL